MIMGREARDSRGPFELLQMADGMGLLNLINYVRDFQLTSLDDGQDNRREVTLFFVTSSHAIIPQFLTLSPITPKPVVGLC